MMLVAVQETKALIDRRYRGGSSRLEFSFARLSELALLRILLGRLCKGQSPEKSRRTLHDLLELIRGTDNPRELLVETLDYCVRKGGVEGLEIAIDILTHFPAQVQEYVPLFLATDEANWSMTPRRSRTEDDAWYVLAHVLAQGAQKDQQKFAQIAAGLKGTWSMRDGSLRALAQVGGPEAREIIERFAQDNSEDAFVRETAQELLDSWEE